MPAWRRRPFRAVHRAADRRQGQGRAPGAHQLRTLISTALRAGLTKTKPARDFMGVLRNLWWRLDSALTVEDCYYSALVDLARCGSASNDDDRRSPPPARTPSPDRWRRSARPVKEDRPARVPMLRDLRPRRRGASRRGIEENAAFIRVLPAPARGTLRGWSAWHASSRVVGCHSGGKPRVWATSCRRVSYSRGGGAGGSGRGVAIAGETSGGALETVRHPRERSIAAH